VGITVLQDCELPHSSHRVNRQIMQESYAWSCWSGTAPRHYVGGELPTPMTITSLKLEKWRWWHCLCKVGICQIPGKRI